MGQPGNCARNAWTIQVLPQSPVRFREYYLYRNSDFFQCALADSVPAGGSADYEGGCHQTRGAIPGAKVWRGIPKLQGQGTEVDLAMNLSGTF